MDKRRAEQELKNFSASLTIPGYRYGSKVERSVENIERGYAVDQRGRFLYTTTPFGEYLNLLGIAPEKAVESRELAHTLHNLSLEYHLDKQDAVDGLLSGDARGMARFMQKWGKPIDAKDLQRAMQERMSTPAQRAVQGLPQDVQMRELMQRGQMPRR